MWKWVASSMVILHGEISGHVCLSKFTEVRTVTVE